MSFSLPGVYNPGRRVLIIITNKYIFMATILWIVFGGLVGWIEDLSMPKVRQNVALDIVFGVVGAVIGVWVATLFGLNGFISFDWWSLLASFLGAVILVWIVSAFRE